jgi:SAM-dependent methyltransferase
LGDNIPLQGKRTYFNGLAGEWDSIPRPDDAQDRIERFCRRACPDDSKLVLDVGCGTGVLAPHLAELLRPDARLVELDYAVEMLRVGREKYSRNNIEYTCADILQPPFREASFDAVMCFAILPHLGDTKAALERLLRLLKPRGTLAVGHLMGSVQLNETHQNIGGPVGHDHLPSGAELESMLGELDAVGILAEDIPENYFVRCEKCAE